MRIQRTLGRFPSPTPCWFLVRMYLCGYVACSARAPAQHCWMCCANERNIVGPRFDDRETIEMLALVGSEVWPVSNFIQQLPTSRNNTQQHTTWCANARNMLEGFLPSEMLGWLNLGTGSPSSVYDSSTLYEKLNFDLINAKVSCKNRNKLYLPLCTVVLVFSVQSERKLCPF